MIYIPIAIASVAALLKLVWVLTRNSHEVDQEFIRAIAATFIPLIVFCISPIGIAFCGGTLPEYSTGQREGYITKVSYKGMLFKTHECEVQVGTGEMAALQDPWRCSTIDEEIAQDMESLIGKRVRVHYNEWFIQPIWEGSSGYKILKVEVIE